MSHRSATAAAAASTAATAADVITWRAGPNYDCFVVNGTIRCSGLHRFLRESLYPTWKRPAAAAAIATGKCGRPKGRGQLLKAMRLGSLVDTQLNSAVSDEKTKPRKKQHPYTKAILEAFGEWKWTPIESQGIIGKAPARLATAFDILCRTRNGERVLVQVKTGFEGMFRISGGQRLEHPSVSKVPSTPQTHAILQAAMEARLFEEMRATSIDHVYVVRACSEGCERVLVKSTDAKLAKKRPRWLPKAMAVLEDRIRERVARFKPRRQPQ